MFQGQLEKGCNRQKGGKCLNCCGFKSLASKAPALSRGSHNSEFQPADSVSRRDHRSEGACSFLSFPPRPQCDPFPTPKDPFGQSLLCRTLATPSKHSLATEVFLGILLPQPPSLLQILEATPQKPISRGFLMLATCLKLIFR